MDDQRLKFFNRNRGERFRGRTLGCKVVGRQFRNGRNCGTGAQAGWRGSTRLPRTDDDADGYDANWTILRVAVVDTVGDTQHARNIDDP